ncbi:helix-turn-helix domain-containing protein [Nocardioides sp. L-11A]|uniref:helix-turn-helix domain-containing protein n=1 Tax=Nocardioides sp. L-11A TaxID=3043848 RepID=UPI00249C96C2|nr:helix-turn-helix domain-containing protein [Nocardioides sp. L-11A]
MSANAYTGRCRRTITSVGWRIAVHAHTVRDLGALVRAERHRQALTQAELADRIGVSREWVVRLEAGHPRLEAQRVLDALAVLGLVLHVVSDAAGARAAPRPVGDGESIPEKAGTTAEKVAKAVPGTTGEDPFEALFSKRRR